MIAAHSPGPWRRGVVSTKRDRTNVYAITDARGKRICDVREYDETATADIRLIATAPELLALAELLVDSHGLRPGHVAYVSKASLIERAKELIAKAGAA